MQNKLSSVALKADQTNMSLIFPQKSAEKRTPHECNNDAMILLLRYTEMFFCLPDGEQLAQPEFAGLWDKQAAFKPVGVSANEMPRAKMCKASKMEQVCLIL